MMVRYDSHWVFFLQPQPCSLAFNNTKLFAKIFLCVHFVNVSILAMFHISDCLHEIKVTLFIELMQIVVNLIALE